MPGAFPHRFLIFKRVGFNHAKKLKPKTKENIMFNKNKNPNEIRPANKSPRDKQDQKNKNPRENKNSAQEKSAMRSEGGKN